VSLSDDFDGWATANHLDLGKMPIKKALNVVWHYLTKDGDQKGIDALRANLMRPLPGDHEVSEEVVSAELDMFRTAMSKKI
jgi:hypothetical protein